MKINVLVHLSKLSNKGVFARVYGFLSYCLLMQISSLVLLTPNCPSTQVFHFTDCLFILKIIERIPDVHSVCFENQQATDCWKWD